MRKSALIIFILITAITFTSCHSGEKSDLSSVSDSETEEIISLLHEYAEFYWGLFPINGPPKELIDGSQTVSEGSVTFFKVVSGDIQDEETFNKKLDLLLSQRLKKEFIEDPERHFRFFEGDLYIAGAGAGGWGVGMDRLILDDIRYTDENTITVTVTSFGDKDNWGTSEDILHSAFVEIVKAPDGFRIERCDNNIDIALYFFFYDEIIWGDKSISLVTTE